MLKLIPIEERVGKRCIVCGSKFAKYIHKGAYLCNAHVLAYTKEKQTVDSHYDYLDKHLDLFWRIVVGKSLNDTYHAGIISAHGDKAYSYKSIWEEAGLDFNRAMLMYLLSYKMEHLNRSKVSQWVIDNYHVYDEVYEKIEKQVKEKEIQELDDIRKILNSFESNI